MCYSVPHPSGFTITYNNYVCLMAEGSFVVSTVLLLNKAPLFNNYDMSKGHN